MKPPHTIINVPGMKDIETLEHTVSSIRGTIIGAFVRIETMMDSIIIKTTFHNAYTEYMEILVPSGNINMKTKLKLFELCVDKYRLKYGGDFSKMMDQLRIIVEIRDDLAHKLLDTTNEGVDMFVKKGKFRFIVFKNDKPDTYREYSTNMVDNNLQVILKIQNGIKIIFNGLGCEAFKIA